MSDLGDVIEDQLRAGIPAAFAMAGDQSMVTRWVLIAEVIEPAGHRGVWTFTSADAMRWDTVGLLTHALDLERLPPLDGS